MNDFLTRFAQHIASPPGIGLQLLCMEPLVFDAEMLATSLRNIHHSLQAVEVDWLDMQVLSDAADAMVQGDGPPATHLGLVGWEDHEVKIVGFSSPMPPGPLSGTLAHSVFVPTEMKADVQQHVSHILLEYSGHNTSVLERYTAVAMVAYALYPFGAVITLNEEARAAVPTSGLAPEEEGEDFLASLRLLPLPYLYGGFVKMELSDPPGQIWFRTFANFKFDLPDIAIKGHGHAAFTTMFPLFCSITKYLLDTGFPLEIGETMRVDEDTYYTLREPKPEEWWLDSEGRMVVLGDAEV